MKIEHTQIVKISLEKEDEVKILRKYLNLVPFVTLKHHFTREEICVLDKLWENL